MQDIQLISFCKSIINCNILLNDIITRGIYRIYNNHIVQSNYSLSFQKNIKWQNKVYINIYTKRNYTFKAIA